MDGHHPSAESSNQSWTHRLRAVRLGYQESIPDKQYQCHTSSMRGKAELRILQYNVYKSRQVVTASLFTNPKVTEYDILAFQEPWQNGLSATAYHPLKTHTHLAYMEDSETRVCFFISRRLDSSTWNVSFITRDISVITINHPLHSTLHIVNVYNEVGTSTLDDARETISKIDQNDEILLLGDFNLHNPVWSAIPHLSSSTIRKSRQLLNLTEDFQIDLITVPGTKTHRWNDGTSTIDLAFVSEMTAS